MSAHCGGFGLFDMHLEAGVFGLLARGRARTQRDGHFLDARIAQVLRMGVALAAVAEDGDLLAGDQVDVAIGVVINLHQMVYPSKSLSRADWPESAKLNGRRRLMDGEPRKLRWPLQAASAPRIIPTIAGTADFDEARARASARRSCRSCRAGRSVRK